LRLIGSRHSGSGLVVEALMPAGEIWEFDSLADEVLPFTRAEVVDLRIRRAARDAGRRRRNQRRTMVARGFNVGTLWEARLSDLQALVNRVRWFGELPEGQRDYWMFLAANAMSYLAPPERMEREAYALARDVCRWDDRETISRLHAVFKRALMAQGGETIEWPGGADRPPLPLQDRDDHRAVGDHARGAEADAHSDLAGREAAQEEGEAPRGRGDEPRGVRGQGRPEALRGPQNAR